MLREGIAKHRWWIALSAVALALLAVAPYFLSPFHVRVGQQVLFAAGLALSWTILGGFAGYWSFGHAAFVGLGAFAASLSASSLVALPTALGFAAALLIGSIACGVVAAIIAYPVLRLRGIYFAIAMLGVSQVPGDVFEAPLARSRAPAQIALRKVGELTVELANRFAQRLEDEASLAGFCFPHHNDSILGRRAVNAYV